MTMATRTSWKNEPIDNPKRIALSLHFTEEQFAKLREGLIPEQMEDKWFIFYEDGWLYFHRSWTGYGIYKAHLIKDTDGYAIQEYWVESNPDKYQSQGEVPDWETLLFLIAQGLLGMNVNELYTHKNLHSDSDVLNAWGLFGNMLFGVRESE